MSETRTMLTIFGLVAIAGIIVLAVFIQALGTFLTYGRILGRAYGEIRQFYPRPGWVEHDPEQIYRSVVRLGRQAIAASRIRPAGIGAVGITNQRETFVVWERHSARPVHRAIVWQCRRSAAICTVRLVGAAGTTSATVAALELAELPPELNADTL